jgi:hypothetical protein
LARIELADYLVNQFFGSLLAALAALALNLVAELAIDLVLGFAQ